jgi:hypothetical protein
MILYIPKRGEAEVGESTAMLGKGQYFGLEPAPIEPDHTDHGIVARRTRQLGTEANRQLVSMRQTGSFVAGVQCLGVTPAEIMAAANKVPKCKLKKNKLYL